MTFNVFRNHEVFGVLAARTSRRSTKNEIDRSSTLVLKEITMKSRWRGPILGMIFLLSLGLMTAVNLGAQDPWEFLDGFTPLPSSSTRIAERYVAMIFVNRDEQLMAAVFFDATCVADSCELNHRAGYAVVNTEGSYTRLYVDPQEEELKKVLTSISARYSRQS
jgi:hypothetical protein